MNSIDAYSVINTVKLIYTAENVIMNNKVHSHDLQQHVDNMSELVINRLATSYLNRLQQVCKWQVVTSLILTAC